MDGKSESRTRHAEVSVADRNLLPVEEFEDRNGMLPRDSPVLADFADPDGGMLLKIDGKIFAQVLESPMIDGQFRRQAIEPPFIDGDLHQRLQVAKRMSRFVRRIP